MTLELDELRTRFEEALRKAGARSKSETHESLFRELAARHSEAHRHYHTLAHVRECLKWLDWSAKLARHSAEVELALFFHDAIYDPRANDNEEQSAKLARERLAEAGLPAPVLDRIEAHILATSRHEADDADGRLVVDIDLAILGASRARFDEFERAIREEYRHVPIEHFRAGRRAVLERFLERPSIYRLPAFRDELEARARANLERRLAELSTA